MKPDTSPSLPTGRDDLPQPAPSTTSLPDVVPAHQSWRRAAWLASGFAGVLAIAMLVSHLQTKADDPLQSPRLKAAKEKLRLSPTDEALKQDIRQLDLQLRQKYFRHVARMRLGGYLLLGGAGVFIVAFTQAARYRRRLPMPQPRPDAVDEAARAQTLARWSVGASGAAIAAFLVLLSLGLKSAVPQRVAEIDKLLGGEPAPPAASDAAAPEELARNWPQFHGPLGSGVSIYTNYPASWDTKTGAGIAWKAPVPASGFNSPIVWGERVFFSGGDAHKREVFCLDAKTGQLLWRQAIEQAPGNPAQAAEVPDSTGYAASTMATDGRRVYAIFANGDLAAVTLEGKLVWSKNLGPLKNPYGHATSLATWRDRVIVQLDQGDSEEGKSKLYALDGRTGQVVWQKPRKVGSSWATPIVIEAAGKAQIIALAVPFVTAYAAADGAELWKAETLNGEITPSPAFANGMLYIASPSEKLVAIRPNGQGDVTKTSMVWTNEDNVPDVTSPASNGELVFALTTPGMLTCFDAKDGKKLWEHDFETECHASPCVAGNCVYVFAQKGNAFVVEAGREFKEIFRTDMGDNFHATPAFAPGRIFLRGVTNVWCLGSP